MQKRSFLAVILGLVAILMFALSGCGSSGPTSAGGGGMGAGPVTGNFGTLTLSGSGTAIVGTSFKPSILPFNNSIKWWCSNFSTMQNYPYAALIINNGTIVSFTWNTSAGNPVAGWNAAVASGSASMSMTATTVTFNNLILNDASGAPTLILNGQLTF